MPGTDCEMTSCAQLPSASTAVPPAFPARGARTGTTPGLVCQRLCSLSEGWLCEDGPGQGAIPATPSLDLKRQVRGSPSVNKGREAHRVAPAKSLHVFTSIDCRWYGDAVAPIATTRRDQPSTIEEHGLMKSDHSMRTFMNTNTNDMLLGAERP